MTPRVPQKDTETVIATSRAVLAVASLGAVWLDPTEPARYAAIAYTLMVLYMGYATLVALWVHRREVVPARLPLTTHVIDLGVFTLFLYFTEGATSPFFLYFVFSLVCAALRWEWRGVAWTAPVALATFFGLGAFAEHILRDHEFELNRFIIRATYLAVMAGLFGYIGLYQVRRRTAMLKLATWPRAAAIGQGLGPREIARHVAAIFETSRLVLLWEERDEPWLRVGSWSRGEFALDREAPDALTPVVAEPLAGSAFFCPNIAAARPLVVRRTEAGFEQWHGQPLGNAVVERFDVVAVLAVPLRGENVEGWLLVLDQPRISTDDLLTGEVVGRQVSAGLDQLAVVARLQEAAATEERIRLARDIHDGVLQSLTGMALKLKGLERLLAEPDRARAEIEDIRRLVATEQHDLRTFVSSLRPAARVGAWDLDLRRRLEELGARVGSQWDLRIEVEASGAPPVARTQARAVYLIVHESLVNAARHAGATRAQVDVRRRDQALEITVADDGRGFPFHGRHDMKALEEHGRGPVSLRQRLKSLGGTLTIESTASGSRLEMSLPLDPATP
jgi:signal transduction histidine kinase